MFIGRCELMETLDDKLNSSNDLKERSGDKVIPRNILQNNISSGGISGHGIMFDHLTKCYVAQVLLDLYELMTIELHRQADHHGVTDDVFDRYQRHLNEG